MSTENDIETCHSLSQPIANNALQLGDNEMSYPHALFQVRIVCGQVAFI